MFNVRNEIEKSIQNLALLSSVKREKKIEIPDLPKIEITKADDLHSLHQKVTACRRNIAPVEKQTVFVIALAMVDLGQYRSIYITTNNLPVCELVACSFDNHCNHSIIIDLCKFKEIYQDIQKQYGPRPIPRL